MPRARKGPVKVAEGFALPTDVVSDMLRVVEAAHAAEGAELEARVYAPLWPVASLRGVAHGKTLVDMAMFDRLVRTYRAKSAETPVLSLDVSVPVPNELVADDPALRGLASATLRASVIGADAVVSFLRTDQFPADATELMVKQRIRAKNGDYAVVDVPNYGFRVAAKSEVDARALPNDFYARAMRFLSGANLVRTYRLKNRRSFATADGLVRVDLTEVKSSEGVRAVSSGVLGARDAYEVEVEVVGNAAAQTVADAIASEVSGILVLCQGTRVPLSLEDTRESALGYFRSVFGASEIPEMAVKHPRRFFPVPQPVTLELRNCLPPEIDVVSVMTPEYTVTEKADGERCLVYVTPGGRVVYLTNRLVFRGLAASVPELSDSLYDVEHVTSTRENKAVDLFLVFDCYRFCGKDVSDRDLRERLGHCEDLERRILALPEPRPRVTLKRFRFDPVPKACGALLEEIASGAFEYRTDGLILTPTGPIPARESKTPQRNISGTCDTIFKWKPVEENTIDMLVRFDPSDSVGVDDRGRRTVRCALMVGNNHRHQPVDPVSTLAALQAPGAPKRVTLASEASATTDEFLMGTVALPLAPDGRSVLAENGELVRPNSVVEFRYSSDSWVPTRVRQDKTELFVATGSALGAANDYRTAMNVLASIRNPVTEDVLTGRRRVRDGDVAELYDDVYYADARGGAVLDSSTVNRHMEDMRNFHNVWIKGVVLIGAAAQAVRARRGGGEEMSLFDMACGKGGDLPKWRRYGFTTVVGVDASADNLVNPVNGAYARLVRYANSPPQSGAYGRPPSLYVFLQMDCSSRWTATYLREIASSSSSTASLTAMAFRVGGASETTHGPGLSKVYGAGVRGADVVTCNFALHYFCKTEGALAAFCHNVAMVLADGGFFVGCCMDGHELLAQLNATADGVLEGAEPSTRETMWRVRRLSASPLSKAEFDARPFGQAVEVFVSTIGKRAVEYLVHFDRVAEELGRHGIRVMSREDPASEGFFVGGGGRTTGMFSEAYDADRGSPMSDEAKRFSFANRFFVMRKAG